MRSTPAVRFTAALTVLLATLVGLAAAAPASAAGQEQIDSYDTTMRINASGAIAVSETIKYDFGNNERHGIIRKIPARFVYDKKHYRVYDFSDFTVTQDGQPAQFRTSGGNYEVIKIGDPNETINGVHTYVIGYTVGYAINTFADHDELYWNVVGNEWPVPVNESSATVTGDGVTLTDTACYSGPENSHTNCQAHALEGGKATFTGGTLATGSELTVVVALPAGAVANPGPKLTTRRTVATFFTVNPWTIGAGILLLLIGVGGALLIGYLVGRDRRYVGILPGLTPEFDDPNVQQRKPLIGAPPVSVEFTPPGDLRPGQVGTLIDERANVVDVTATIVDFAVRKHLRIVEVPPDARGNRDWELVKLTNGDPKFLPYERRLFDAIFHGAESVRLSGLKYHFATELALAQRALYNDMVQQGWYRQSPERTRQVAYGLGIAVLIGAVAVTVGLGLLFGAGLAGLGLVAGAVALLFAAGSFPARTGKGSAVLARVQGFRLYVATAETAQIAFQEREQIFSRYLPYAMVFGLVDRWAGEFKDLAASGSNGLYWYTGAPNWSMLYFAASIGAFNTTATGTIAYTMPTASSGSGVFGGSGFGGGGFSGGGGGGGGGGSW